jgi:hypothetical protein
VPFCSTYQGTLLSVSLLGLSKSITLSMSDIISCLLIRRMRLCLLCPSATVSPGCSQAQPEGKKTKAHKKIAKITIQTKTDVFFITFSLFLSLTSQLRFSYNRFCTCQPARSLFEQQKSTDIYKCIITAINPAVNSNRVKKASSLVREYLLKSKSA